MSDERAHAYKRYVQLNGLPPKDHGPTAVVWFNAGWDAGQEGCDERVARNIMQTAAKGAIDAAIERDQARVALAACEARRQEAETHFTTALGTLNGLRDALAACEARLAEAAGAREYAVVDNVQPRCQCGCSLLQHYWTPECDCTTFVVPPAQPAARAEEGE